MRPITARAVKFITKVEGRRLAAYPDSGGTPTIGVGHTKGVKLGDKITAAQSDAFLAQDLKEAAERLYRNVKPDILEALPEERWITLLSWAFNVPEGKWTLYKRLNDRAFDKIPTELHKFIYDNGAPVAGLVNRRNAEVDLWNAAPAPVAPPAKGPTPEDKVQTAPAPVAPPAIAPVMASPVAQPAPPPAKPLAGVSLSAKVVTLAAGVGATATQVNEIVAPHSSTVPFLGKLAMILTSLVVISGIIGLLVHNHQSKAAKR